MPFNNLTNAVIKYKTKGKVEGKKRYTPSQTKCFLVFNCIWIFHGCVKLLVMKTEIMFYFLNYISYHSQVMLGPSKP